LNTVLVKRVDQSLQQANEMYKNFQKDIKQYYLGPSLHKLHKEGVQESDFGMDNSPDLLDGAFGLYSAKDLKKRIGPIKSEYFRIGLVRSGKITFGIGLEKFQAARNSIIFGFPGQIFSLDNPDEDFFCYYMLFSEKFIADSPLLNSRQDFPFLSYSGQQCFSLREDEAMEIESLFLKTNQEIKIKKPNIRQVIQIYIQLTWLHAKRSYEAQELSKQEYATSGNDLFRRFVKLVSQHFLELHKVSEYAERLNVSADHLNRTIKTYSDKTAHELIDAMLLVEAKAHLVHTQLSIAEIAYKLEFSDPSHFNKFFKKLTNHTHQSYRSSPAE
jgi:AraC family transcriptional regulator, transcriptional activator of pobA